MRWTARATRTALATLLTGGLLGSAAGCAGPGTSGDAVELTMWAWAPNVTEVVDLWNAENPDVQVTVDTQAQGDDLVTKLLTADWAGTGPDLAQAEYQALPSLVVSGVAKDMTDDVAPVQDAYPQSVWDQVTFDGEVYALPQDLAPMMMYYRADLMAEMGLTIPTTWEEFAAVAAQVRAMDDERWLTTFSASDPGWFAGLAQGAGAEWWTLDDDGWTVGIDEPATEQVAAYWGDLLADDLVLGSPMYSPDWNSWLNDGTLLAWPGAVWSPAVLEGIAPDTAGSWVMAPMPQWDPAQPRTGLWGGSTTAIMDETEHAAEAAEFARWLNTAPEALDALITTSNVYPAATAAQDSPALAEPPSFMPNQPDFYATVAEITQSVQPVTWGPTVNVTYSAYGDAFGSAVQRGTPFPDALAAMQDATFATMDGQGFRVEER